MTLKVIHSIVVPYELYDGEKVSELYGTSQFYVLGRLLFSAGVYGVELKQLTKILYGICYVLCFMFL